MSTLRRLVLGLCLFGWCLAASALAGGTQSDDPGDVVLFAGDPAKLGTEERAALVDPRAVLLCLENARPAWMAERAPVVLPVREERLPGDSALAARVERAPVIVLCGGTFLDWWHTLRTKRGEASRLQRALLAARRRGALICGSGGAAAWLASGFAPRADLEGRERNPRAPQVTEVALGGLGLGGGVLLDGAGIADARWARLLDATHRHRAERALFLIGDVAWRWSAREERASVSGAPDGRALLLDTAGARRDRNVLRGRLSWLAPGDGYDLRRRRATPSADGVPRERQPARDNGRRTLVSTCVPAALAMQVERALAQKSLPARIECTAPQGTEAWLVLIIDSAAQVLSARSGEHSRILDVRVEFRGLPLDASEDVHR